ncbi:hypothetical protein FQN60_006689 [Etheostoma spectabile]|uniref:Uncharacterized protein n=1 Tax=Etheostoma spectabile TaxID=54343 RepID=A0A5J5CG97_9PERO|nr:hypothetical protein FQN60_006689 [Etheostoma spectabile]
MQRRQRVTERGRRTDRKTDKSKDSCQTSNSRWTLHERRRKVLQQPSVAVKMDAATDGHLGFSVGAEGLYMLEGKEGDEEGNGSLASSTHAPPQPEMRQFSSIYC